MGPDDSKPPMRICVCGWYYRPEFYRVLDASVYKRCTVGKRASYYADTVIANIGLEWAAYDYYVRNVWEGEDVLFTHDDAEITQEALDTVNRLDGRCNFIFQDEDAAGDNGKRGARGIGIHGRAFKLRGDLIRALGGFWFDWHNDGVITHPIPPGKLDYNMGIIKLYDRLIEMGEQIGNVYVKGYNTFRRNRNTRG